MTYPLLDRIHAPADLRAMATADLPALAVELRAFLIESVSATGGHLGPNLGGFLQHSLRRPVQPLD